MTHQAELTIATPTRGFTDVTDHLRDVVRNSDVAVGLCSVFVLHTSASLIIQENADPDVRHDLEQWMARHAPDGDPRYRHSEEGPDDMPAHIRAALTATSLSIPVRGGELLLGTWQGVYLYEHRYAPHQRRLIVTVV